MTDIQVMFPLTKSASGSDPEAMHYKGPVASASDLPENPNHGDTYKATASFTLSGEKIEPGDLIVYNENTPGWDIYQGNVDGVVIGPASSTDAHIAVFDGTSGKEIKDSGYTIAMSIPANAVFTDVSVTSVDNHYTPTGTTTKSASGATGTSGTPVQVVTGVTVDAAGHVTAVTSGEATDTTYTADVNGGLTLNGTAFSHSNSITAGNCKPSVNASSQLVVGGVEYDAQGHVTEKETKTVKITTPIITVTPSKASTVTAVTNAGTVPSWSASIESETLEFSWSAGAMPTFSIGDRLTGISSASSTAPGFEVVTT